MDDYYPPRDMKISHEKNVIWTQYLYKKYNWKKPASCLDAAYERHAVEQGLNTNPVFPENQPDQRED